jgi:membrane protease YdiL (CAAX protease family)
MNQDIQPHTVWQSLVLHLFPGALLTAVYFAITPLITQAGYPALAALFLSILVVLLPFELGVLFVESRKRNGRLSLAGVVLNQEPIPLWQYFVLVPLLLAWSAGVFIGLSSLDSLLMRSLFAWLPSGSAPTAFLDIAAQYPRSVLQITALLGLLLNGIAGPAVEELYFRGYLMPRIPSSRKWAPLINAVLFSLYHFFSPWQFVTRIIALIPTVYTVSWKRNLYVSMIMHCLLNTIGMLSILTLVFR